MSTATGAAIVQIVANDFASVIVDSAVLHDQVHPFEECEAHRRDLERLHAGAPPPVANVDDVEPWPDPVEATRLFQSFAQGLILDGISDVPFSPEFEDLAVELGAGIGVTPQRAGSLLQRVVEESRKRVKEIAL